MKTFNLIAKILTALAAAAGAVYVIATYGDQIVAWAKKALASMPKCPCCEKDFAEEEAPAEEAPAAEEAPTEEASAAEEVVAAEAAVAEEAPAEEPAEEAPVEEETVPVAEEADFEA